MSSLYQVNYRIQANRPPLLIEPPPIQNSNKPPLFCPKVHFLGLFGQKLEKKSIDHHLESVNFFYKPLEVYLRQYSINEMKFLQLSNILWSDKFIIYLAFVDILDCTCIFLFWPNITNEMSAFQTVPSLHIRQRVILLIQLTHKPI